MKNRSLHLWTAVAAAGLLCAMATPTNAADSAAPKVGDTAPKFEGKNQNGEAWKLDDALGKGAVLLYFYPKDDTPGCTRQACGLRDQMSDLKQEGVQVVGVSFDSAQSHQEFIKKHDLNFTLLADTDGKIADAYGARMPDRDLARRVSFLIGKDGKIKHITDNRSADVHLTEVKDAVANLAKN